jgi:hypothetical protein
MKSVSYDFRTMAKRGWQRAKKRSGLEFARTNAPGTEI